MELLTHDKQNIVDENIEKKKQNSTVTKEVFELCIVSDFAISAAFHLYITGSATMRPTFSTN